MGRTMTGQVVPIGTELQREVVEQTGHFIVEAEGIFERRFSRIPVTFDLKGQAAGMFRIAGRRMTIRYNPWIFAKYYDDNLRDTVPHEVAHYIIHQVFGSRACAHGPEWRDLMICFGANPKATFEADLSGIPQRRQATHRYRCDCRIHQVSTTRHNRVRRGSGRYHCSYCSGQLIYAP